MKKLLIIALGLSVLASCSGPSKKQSNDSETTPATEKAASVFSIAPNSSKVLWTAYKLSEKVGVNGTFDEVALSGAKEAASIEELVTGLSISIPTASVNSADPERDVKIRKTFFTALNTDTIQGVISSVSGTDCTVNFTLNGMTKEVKGSLKQKENRLVWNGVLDLGDFDGKNAVDALNAVCKERHTGKDGTSILWPDVAIKWVVNLN